MIVLLALLAFIGGFGLPYQTLANTKLAPKIGTPPAAGLVAITVATVILGAFLYATEGYIIPDTSLLAALPWWVWLSGFISVIGIVGFIFVFPKLGAIETALWPMLGSILGSIAVDQFGLFEANVIPLDVKKAVGAAIVTAGLVLAVIGKRKTGEQTEQTARLPWRLFAFFIGLSTAAMVAINGRCATGLESAFASSLLNYVVGTLVLLVLVGVGTAMKSSLFRIEKPAKGEWGPAWIWVGGPIAFLYILGLTWAQPVIGTGVTMMLNVVGQISASAMIDHFGVAGTPRSPITAVQAGGIGLMVVGLAAIQLL